MFRNVALSLGLLLGMGLPVFAQTPPPKSAEEELKAPYDPTDEKPTPGALSNSRGGGWSAFGSVVLVLGLAGGGLWAFRKWGVKRMPGTGGSRLKVEETLSLGDRRFVSILRADDEKFLIALSPQSISLLARLDSFEAPETPGFERVLDRQIELNRPMPVKDVEAMIKGDRS